MKVIISEYRCKFCSSANIIKHGRSRGIQRYFCNGCKRKFADNDALPGMKTSVDHVASALSMYYEGMSLNAIRRHLDQTGRIYPSDSTVYEWGERFTKQAISEAAKHRPQVGDTWVADETVLRIDGKNVWFWDIIDARTRFLLASHVSHSRTTRDARTLMEKAQERAEKVPKIVLTDKLAGYVDGIEQAFGADSKHIQSKRFTVHDSTNLIERFQGTLKDRTKIMRGLKDVASARLFTGGWLVHYNYLRPHEALNGKTPAEVSGIRFPFRNWRDIVAEPRVTIKVERVSFTPVGITPAKPRMPQAFGFPSSVGKSMPKRRPQQMMGMTSRKQGGQYVTTSSSGGVLLSRHIPRGSRLVRSRKGRTRTVTGLRW